MIWLDNNKERAVKTDSNWLFDRYDTIATRVNPGYHTITIRTIRDGVFIVCGVLVGPPDFRFGTDALMISLSPTVPVSDRFLGWFQLLGLPWIPPFSIWHLALC